MNIITESLIKTLKKFKRKKLSVHEPDVRPKDFSYLKNCIDWISRLPNQPLDRKPVCIQSASLGPLGGARVQYHLRQILVFLNAKVMNKNEIFVTFAKQKFDESSGKLTDDITIDFIGKQLDAFYDFIDE